MRKSIDGGLRSRLEGLPPRPEIYQNLIDRSFRRRIARPQNFLLEKSGRHERFSPGKSAISKVQCSLPFQVRQLFKFSNKKRRSDLLAFGRSAVSPFQDRFVFFRNRSHCGLKWAGEGSGAEAPVLPSCATHPPLPVSGSVFGSCAATP